MDKNFLGKRFKPGDPMPSADDYNQLAEFLEALCNLEAGPGLLLYKGRAGMSLAHQQTPNVYAQLTGSGSPYSMQEVVPTSGGGWTSLSPGGRSCTSCAYEVNGVSGLNGKYAELVPFAQEYRFQFIQHATSVNQCIAIQNPCGSDQIPGLTVSVYSGATLIASCETTGTITGFTVTNTGSGYSSASPPTVTIATCPGGGSGSTAAATVNGLGEVSGISLTLSVSGYTCRPLVSIGGGGGSGATAIALMAAQCCVSLPSTGSYTVTVTSGGTTLYSGSATLTGSLYTITLPIGAGQTCADNCSQIPLDKTLTVTDSVIGSFTFKYQGVDGSGRPYWTPDPATYSCSGFTGGGPGSISYTYPGCTQGSQSCPDSSGYGVPLCLGYVLYCNSDGTFGLSVHWSACNPPGGGTQCPYDENACPQVSASLSGTTAPLNLSGSYTPSGSGDPAYWLYCNTSPTFTVTG